MNEVSDCQEGNFKIIRNHTTTYPTIWKGCFEEHYFDPDYREHGGCVLFSLHCDLDKTRKCKTAHDRICTDWNPPEMLGKSKLINNGPSALKMSPRALFRILSLTSFNL